MSTKQELKEKAFFFEEFTKSLLEFIAKSLSDARKNLNSCGGVSDGN